jgi:hypothetical protein
MFKSLKKISYAKELLFYVAEILGFVAFAAFSPVLKITSK